MINMYGITSKIVSDILQKFFCEKERQNTMKNEVSNFQTFKYKN